MSIQIVRDVRFGCDYLDENDVLHVGGDGGVMVLSEAKLALIADHYGPGVQAHTAGYVGLWEKGIDGTWTDMKGGN